MNKSDLITPLEALEMLAMPTDTESKQNNGKFRLRKLALAGQIKGYRFGSVRYSRQSILDYIESCTITPLQKRRKTA